MDSAHKRTHLFLVRRLKSLEARTNVTYAVSVHERVCALLQQVSEALWVASDSRHVGQSADRTLGGRVRCVQNDILYRPEQTIVQRRELGNAGRFSRAFHPFTVRFVISSRGLLGLI